MIARTTASRFLIRPGSLYPSGATYCCQPTFTLVRTAFYYLAERESNEAAQNLLTVRDQNSNVVASWTTPRSHQIWPDAHGDVYLVSGVMTGAGGGIATKYVRTR